MLKGNNIVIRPAKPDDLALLVEYINDLESVGPYLPCIFQSESQFRAEYEKTGFLSESLTRLVVTDRSHKIIGLTWSFRSIPYFSAFEVGYRIFDVRNRSKGYATEALGLLCKYLFESCQVNRLELRVATENLASQKVATKCGFDLEGTHKQAAFSKGILYDMHTYALLRENWATTR